MAYHHYMWHVAQLEGSAVWVNAGLEQIVFHIYHDNNSLISNK